MRRLSPLLLSSFVAASPLPAEDTYLPVYWSARDFEDYPRDEARLKNILSRARENWDSFDTQAEFVSFIVMKDLEELLGHVRLGEVYLHHDAADDTLIHEMTHPWYGSTPEEFDLDWKTISEDCYIGRNFSNIDSIDVVTNGAAFGQSLEAIYEDVAETTRLVYLLTNPLYHVQGFPNKTPSFRKNCIPNVTSIPTLIEINPDLIIPKLKGKVGLLREYGFISERERDHALGELEGYVRPSEQ